MDEIDRKIISQLLVNGRTTFENLSKETGLTGVGVKKRVKKMIDREIIKVSALLNIEKLGISAAMVLLEIESAEAMREIFQRFKDCPRVVQIFSTLGGYNIIALVVAENRETLESISLEKCSLRSAQSIRRSEFYPIGRIQYEPFLRVRENLTHRGRTISPCNVDCRTCESFRDKRCVGCPSTHYYRGPL
ncbi:MAG: Lrp/AsnC family transcriptional regulator [Thermoproteota archaeon]